MPSLRVLKHVNSFLEANTYIAFSDDGAALLVDPGSDVGDYLRLVAEAGARVEVVAATHLHPDHAIGVRRAAEVTGALVAYCSLDHPVWNHFVRYVRLWGFELWEESVPDPDIDLCSKGWLTVGGMSIRVVYAPGHSPGSIILYLPYFNVAFTGDVVFKGSVGRVDFPYSDPNDMIETLLRLKNHLSPETLLYPGHGPTTRLADELRENPFLANPYTLYYW